MVLSTEMADSMKNKILTSFILLGIIMLIPNCKKSSTDGSSAARQKAVDDYKNNYLGSAVSTLGWTGNSTSCISGSIDPSVNEKVKQRINYFRRQVGLNDDITLDTAKNRKCQEAALMMYSNGSLNHTPPTTWKCYTSAGAAAAGSSNLGLGYHSVNALNGQMEDAGASNTACGHRRWILFSKAKVMGHGSTPSSQALWVIGSGSTLPSSMPDFIAWPPANFVSSTLVYPRWSFSKPSADFSAAKVSMKDQSEKNIALTVLALASGYGDNTIAWEPVGIVTNSTSDQVYTVTVADVLVSSVKKTFVYNVTIIKI